MEIDKVDVLELTRKLGREPNLKTALLIIQWEVGDLAKSIVYADWHPDLASVYKEEAKEALSALIFQANVVAALFNVTPGELLDRGIEAVEDRIKEMEKKVGRFQHYKGGQDARE